MSGTVHRIVQYLEERRSAFAVSRLIMMTGVAVRQFTNSTPDDEVILRKLDAALPSLLSPEEIEELRQKTKR